MGCDIHAYAEIKRSWKDQEADWYCCENFQLSPYYIYQKKNGGSVVDDKEFDLNPLYRGRNYSTFEALAGVRGIPENCLFDFKNDVPGDMSDFVRSEYDRWDGDLHSPSFMTIKELFSVESKRTVTATGYMTKEDAHKVDTIPGYKPDTWTEHRPIGNMTEFRTCTFEYDPLEEFKKVYFESFKREMYYQYCTDERTLEAIMGEKGDHYRIVFWFDN